MPSMTVWPESSSRLDRVRDKVRVRVRVGVGVKIWVRAGVGVRARARGRARVREGVLVRVGRVLEVAISPYISLHLPISPSHVSGGSSR